MRRARNCRPSAATRLASGTGAVASRSDGADEVLAALGRHPDDIAAIAEAARARTLASHTAEHRAAELVRLLERVRDRVAGRTADDEALAIVGDLVTETRADVGARAMEE